MRSAATYPALALIMVASLAGMTASAETATHQTASPRLAGPWYTPEELKALIAYSNASFERKKKLLAGTSP